MINDTIVASASAPMNQAIAIIRISGLETRKIISKLTNNQIGFFKKIIVNIVKYMIIKTILLMKW